MSRTVRVILGIILVLAIGAAAVYAYVMISGGDGTPSEEISAPTLAIATQSPTEAPTEAPTEEATEAVVEPTAEVTVETAAATTEPTAEVAASSAATGIVVFNIVSDQSQVSFTLTEDLMGQPTTVVGTTNQVAGQIAVDFGAPTNSQVGEIRINARTLATDQGNRDRAIRGQILQSAQDQYEFISFVPTAITGLPDSITVGEAVTFQVIGDLTIRDITQSVTFETTVTPVSETELTGTATTTVQRGDFQLTIPNVPSVANVSEAVDLQIEFVAEAQ